METHLALVVTVTQVAGDSGGVAALSPWAVGTGEAWFIKEEEHVGQFSKSVS